MGRYVSDAIVDVLSDMGCRYLPLNPGSSIRGLHDSLANPRAGAPPQIILCTHEEIAVAAAHTYAKATGDVAFAAVHDLVGLMHASMAVYDAWCDRTPVVVLGGGGPAELARRRPIDWFHSANTQSQLVRPFVKWDADPTDAQATLDAIRRAHQIAISSPPGPAYVTIDAAVQEDPDTGLDRSKGPMAPSPPFVARPEEMATVARLLREADFPVIVAGGVGLIPHSSELLVELMETLGAAGRDERNLTAIPTEHPLCFSGDDSVLRDADVILAVDAHDIRWIRARAGSESVVIDLSTRSLSLRPWLNTDHVGTEAVMSLVSDPIEGVRALTEEIGASQRSGDVTRRATRLEQLGQRRAELDEYRTRQLSDHWGDRPISVYRLVAETYHAVAALPWLLTLRNTRSWPEGIWKFDRAGRYLGHSGGGGMGYGPGALVGGGLAARDRDQIAVGIIGDGDLMYGPGALWTASHHDIPMLVVVNNNQSYLNDEQHQVEVAEARQRPIDNAEIGTAIYDPAIDFATMAQSLGAWAEGPITDPDDLAGALDRAIEAVQQGRVAVVDVHTAK